LIYYSKPDDLSKIQDTINEITGGLKQAGLSHVSSAELAQFDRMLQEEKTAAEAHGKPETAWVQEALEKWSADKTQKVETVFRELQVVERQLTECTKVFGADK
jgi:hypothetical protein